MYDSVDWWRLDVHDLGFEPRLIWTLATVTPLLHWLSTTWTGPRREVFPASESKTQARTGWMQSEIANKYEAYDNKNKFKSLFKRTYHHRRTRSRTGVLVHSKQPWRHSCNTMMSVSRENKELNKTQTLRRAMTAIYRVLGVTPWTHSLMGPNTIHGPTDQKTVSQHPGRF